LEGNFRHELSGSAREAAREFSEKSDPDAEIVSAMLGGAHSGSDGLRRWFGEIEEQFDEWVVMPEEVHGAGDRVAAIGKVRLRGRGSGVSFESPVGWLFEIRDGKLARLQTFVGNPREPLELIGGSQM
jgi:ketosteroid isomerase-like protein